MNVIDPIYTPNSLQLTPSQPKLLGTMNHLLDLPYEVLNTILTEVEPSTLVTLSQCCKDLNRIINDNPLLFKEVYVKKWVRSNAFVGSLSLTGG